MKSYSRRITQFVSSRRFFYVLLGFFVFESVWIALSARYPQAFDEQTHFGLIQLHAKQWWPYFTSQPKGTTMYGAVIRDPSYLYHYLMSFPYRLIEHYTRSLMLQVIILRLINVAMFATGLVLFWRVLRRLGLSPALNNVVLLCLVMTPVVPLLASQINYDNLTFLMSGWLILLALVFQERLAGGRLDMQLLAGIAAVGLAGCLVKYAYLPVFVGVVIMLLAGLWASYRRRRGELLRDVRGSLRSMHPVWLAVYAGLIVLGVALNFERYGINMWRYHTPIPSCNQVLSVARCESYSPWARNYQLAATNPRPTTWQMLTYPFTWVHRAESEMTFTITSNFNADGTVGYYPAPPMPVLNATVWVLGGLSAVCMVAYRRRLWRNRQLRLALFVTAFYAAALFWQNFSDYRHTGEVVAVHGRYLIPVLPLIYGVAALAIAWFMRAYRIERYKPWVVVAVFVLLLQGGGFVTWVMRSEPWWYWAENPHAARLNWLAQDTLGRIEIL